ncbi:MAG: hypothetical protein FI718_03760 [SAR202 cluster bacterium]|nr:hypothetical protein [SAR202 cluster bacterium]
MSNKLSDAGICQNCKFVSRIVSGKGSIFIQCKQHFSNKKFPKYPRLPVTICSGFIENGKD